MDFMRLKRLLLCKTQQYFMPTIDRGDTVQTKRFAFYFTNTSYVVLYLFIASVLNLMSNIPLAAVINCVAAAILLINLLSTKIVGNTKISFVISVITMIIDLFLHQALSEQITLNNYIWLPLFPLILARYVSTKQNIYFTGFLISMVIGARILSPYIPIEWHYMLSPELTLRGDLIALVLFIIFNLAIGDSLNKLEQRAHKVLDSKVKENAHLISILTHDISNQVTVINLACNKLRKQFQETVFCSPLEKIKKRTYNIERLINGVRLSQQAMDSDFTLSRVSLIDLLEAISIEFEKLHGKSNINLIFDYDQSFDYYVAADKNLLLKSAISPMLNTTIGLFKHIEAIEEVTISLKISNKRIKMIISSSALSIFSSPMLSSVNAVSLHEKEAVLAVVVAKKIIEKFGGNVEICPARTSDENCAILFSFPKKGMIS